MALYGKDIDISMFRHLSREFISRWASQEVVYYKIDNANTPVNSYNEATDVFYFPPVLLNCLINRSEELTEDDNYGPDRTKQIEFRFLRDDLQDITLVPEIGDIIEYLQDFYEVHNTADNQYLLGKYPEYALSDATQRFGDSWSIICFTHITRPGKLNILRERL
jgi:hypothetical protein